MRVFFGILIFLADLVVLAMGAYLTLAGFSVVGSGQGNIKIVIQQIGEISGINGHVAVGIIGALLMVVSVILALKAFNESKARVGKVTAKGVLKGIVPAR